MTAIPLNESLLTYHYKAGGVLSGTCESQFVSKSEMKPAQSDPIATLLVRPEDEYLVFGTIKNYTKNNSGKGIRVVPEGELQREQVQTESGKMFPNVRRIAELDEVKAAFGQNSFEMSACVLKQAFPIETQVGTICLMGKEDMMIAKNEQGLWEATTFDQVQASRQNSPAVA